ncbi:MAG: hypothetical protein J1F20_08730 [Muribaculaceae bacterium]|nr:hypothetical protein [Muribaculaceae bacterium]
MKKFNISLYICTMVLGMALTGCTDELDGPLAGTGARKGYLTLNFNINGGTLSRATVAGEPQNNEDALMEVDLFFYQNAAGETDRAVYHYHNDVDEGDEISISFRDLPASITGDNLFKIIAVTNCGSDFENVTSLPTLKDLKEHVVKAGIEGKANTNHRAFRGEDAPQAFVMTNFTQIDGGNSTLKVDEENGTVATIALRRVAAKIRVALNIDETVTDEEGTWTPDKTNMRLYFSNGVRTARLDGSLAEEDIVLNDDDYFSISTTGNKVDDESDYNYSREFKKHDPNTLHGGSDTEHIFYNDLPHYTYPTKWTESMTDTRKPMLTIVIPWRKTDGNGTVYQPTYYSVPVNSTDEDGNGTIDSNTYYYLTTHIGMKGSTTPEVPMKVDAECSILGWGTAATTEVNLSPIRFLIFNQTEYIINNEKSWTVPYMTTHPCTVKSCKIWIYGYNEYDGGDETAVVIDDDTRYGSTYSATAKAKGQIYDYVLNNRDNTLTFTHNMFDAVFKLQRGREATNLFNESTSNNGRYNTIVTETLKDGSTRTYTHKTVVINNRQKAYTRFKVELTVVHTDKQNEPQTPYQETIILNFFPSIYITAESVDETSGALRTKDGYILVNGYGYSNADTGGLKNVQGNGDAGAGDKQKALLTFTVTQLNPDDKTKWGWIIDDPRTMNINNDLDGGNTTLLQDVEILTPWVNGNLGGPYDGTQLSGARRTSDSDRHKYGSGLQTMWTFFEGPTPWTIDWTGGTWDASTDIWSDDPSSPQYHRTLKYYYPASESMEKMNVIAPKYTIVTNHAYAADGNENKNTARRRCAAYQQYGYPAGRWRLPTQAEIKFVKQLVDQHTIINVFGGSNNWSAQGRVDSDGDLHSSGTGYTRCVYDNWYWEQVDANGTSYNKIPDPDGSHANWKKFYWGDRPKENPLTDKSPDAPTVENFIKKATRNH